MSKRQRRTSYETYSAWYDKVSAKEPDMYYDKYTPSEYAEVVENARKANITKNPARTIARHQRKYERAFERQYKRSTGNKLTGKENWTDMYKTYIALGNTHDEWETYLGY